MDEHRSQPGVGVCLERGVHEGVVRSDGDQSTTVVIPASIAPSSPISVAAYTSSGRNASIAPVVPPPGGHAPMFRESDLQA